MKRLFQITLLLFCIFLIQSCSSHKPPIFYKIDSPQSLSGVYVDNENWMLQSFNLKDIRSNIFKLDFKDEQTLDLYNFYNQEFNLLQSYKGQYNKKDNYFQVTFDKTRKIYIICNRISNDFIRVGKDSIGKTIIYKVEDVLANIFIMPAAMEYDHILTLDKISDEALAPIQINDKWGYSNIEGKIIIPAEYEEVTTFSQNLANVKKDSKWALINIEGKILTPFKYDKIDKYYESDSLIRVYQNRKEGFIDTNGKETTTPAFNFINSYNDKNNRYKAFRSRFEGDGIVDTKTDSIIYPPVFYTAYTFKTPGFKTKEIEIPNAIAEVKFTRKNIFTSYIADDKGYLYLLKIKFGGLKKEIVKDSKAYYKDVIKELDKTE